MNPALVGLLGAIPRLTDAFTDPLMGYISDNTSSKWGRRRPYIFFGAIFSGLIFIALWQMPESFSEAFYFWYFLVGSLLFYIAYTVFATPWVALGYELTPDYHERTRLMGAQNFLGQLAYLVSPWFLAIMQSETFDSLLEGASVLAVYLGLLVIVLGVMPSIFLKERFTRQENVEKAISYKAFKNKASDFFDGLVKTLKVKPFRKLCVATFFVFNGFMLIAAFSSYVIIYFVFSGDITLGAEYSGWAGSVGAASTFLVIVFVTWLSSKIGKQKTFYISMWISVSGYVLKWICYTPEAPWMVVIPAPFIAFGLGALFTLMGSMMADVCDLDELNTGERREGMFASIYWWIVKLGMAAAIAASGVLLNLTGFDVDLGSNQASDTLLWMRIFDIVVPVVATLIAVLVMRNYRIDELLAKDIRTRLELRRGSL
jgi:GPH family glycoside/pentoside/hexuronide:cation symporter